MQGWEFAHRFSEQIARFFRQKLVNELFAQKNKQFAHSLIFGERPEQIAHFWWATWAICSHSSLKKREWANRLFKKKHTKNVPKNKFCQIFERFANLPIYHEQSERIAHGRSFVMSDCERFTHGRSFDMSNLSDWLTVTHLSWAIWANCSQLLIWFERMSDERMRKIPNPGLMFAWQVVLGIYHFECF